MNIDFNTIRDALEMGVEGVQMLAAGYLDVAIAIASGVALTFHALRSRIYQPKPKRKTKTLCK